MVVGAAVVRALMARCIRLETTWTVVAVLPALVVYLGRAIAPTQAPIISKLPVVRIHHLAR